MKTIEDKVAVHRAWLKGKQIQVLSADKTEWQDINSPAWDWYTHEYRVKPEPIKPGPAKITVAKAYIHKAGLVQFAVNTYFDNQSNYTRSPEFDIVAKLPDSSE